MSKIQIHLNIVLFVLEMFHTVGIFKKTSFQAVCRAFDAISSFLIWVRAILKGWKLGEKDPHLSKQMTGSILKWTASKEKPMIQFKFP